MLVTSPDLDKPQNQSQGGCNCGLEAGKSAAIYAILCKLCKCKLCNYANSCNLWFVIYIAGNNPPNTHHIVKYTRVKTVKLLCKCKDVLINAVQKRSFFERQYLFKALTLWILHYSLYWTGHVWPVENCGSHKYCSDCN